MRYKWDADQAVMNFIFKKTMDLIFFFIDVFSKYAWTVALKTTKGSEMARAKVFVLSHTSP